MYLLQLSYKKKTNIPNKQENLTFIYIFTGQETKKEMRNAKASLTPVLRCEILTELTEPFLINVHPASEGKCLHFLT